MSSLETKFTRDFSYKDFFESNVGGTGGPAEDPYGGTGGAGGTAWGEKDQI